MGRKIAAPGVGTKIFMLCPEIATLIYAGPELEQNRLRVVALYNLEELVRPGRVSSL